MCCLPDELVVILVAPLYDVGLVVPVLARPVAVDVGVDASAAGQGHFRHQSFEGPNTAPT